MRGLRATGLHVCTVIGGVLLAALIGALAGVGTAAFLHTLNAAARARRDHHWLVAGLPLVGLIVGLVLSRADRRTTGGTDLVLDELHLAAASDRRGVPLLMAPLVFVGSALTHLAGGSAGREGAAVQIAAGLGDGLVGRMLGNRHELRRAGLIAAIAGGFGAVFAVPLAGAVFALEMPTPDRPQLAALPAALTASITGDAVTRGLGIDHGHVAELSVGPLTFGSLARYLAVGVAFGLAARLYVVLTDAVRHAAVRRIAQPALRLAVGGAVVAAALFLIGNRAYEGLSLDLISDALLGVRVATFAWAVKLALTSLTVGSGFLGGEVTPLFAVGAALGSVCAGPVGGDRRLFAALGYVAVFGAASNTPLTFTLIAVERFGPGLLVPAAICCVVARLVSGSSSVYRSQQNSDRRGVNTGTPATPGTDSENRSSD